MNVRFRSKYSLANQIEEKIIEYIRAGVYSADEKLPSIRELAVDLQVNPNTIAKVYAALEERGYVYSLLKKGYYVAPSDLNGANDCEGLRTEIVKTLNAVGSVETRRIIEKILSEEETFGDRDK